MSVDLKDKDTGVNPADSYYDELLNPQNRRRSAEDDALDSSSRRRSAEDSLGQLERGLADASTGQDSSTDSVKSRESSGGWENSVNQVADKLEKAGGVKGKVAGKAIKASSSIIGPTATLGVVSIILVLFMMLSGGIMPLQIVELFTNEHNDNSAATQIRGKRILSRKVDADMKVGTLCTTMNVRCKYKTFSSRQVEKYRKAGFEVEVEDSKVPGRQRVKSMTLEVGDGFDANGNAKVKTLKASNPQEFRRLSSNDADFRQTSTKVYNSRTKTFFSNKFGELSARFKINKSSKLDPEADANANKVAVNKEVGANESAGLRDANGDLVDEDATKRPQADDINSKAGIDQSTVEKVDSDIDSTKNNLDVDTSTSVDADGKVNVDADPNIKGKIAAAGAALCAAYDIPRIITYGVKAIKISKLMAFAMVILPEVHKVKAGEDTDGSSMRIIGEMLSSGMAGKESISDSTAVQLALTGKAPGINEGSKTFHMNYGAVAGFLSAFNGITDSIVSNMGSLGGYKTMAEAETKGTNSHASGIMMMRAACISAEIADTAIGVAGLFTGGVLTFAKEATKMAAQIAIMQIVMHNLPKMLEAVSELALSADTTDADAANALFAGSAFVLGASASAYGMKHATKDEFEKYTAIKNEVNNFNIAHDIEDARSTPFDIANEYSFLGMAVRRANLAIGLNTSIPSRLVGMAGLIPSAISSVVTPKAYAAYSQPQSEYRDERYQDSNDPAATSTGAAVDMFGNPRYSMSAREINLDSDKVAEFMLRHEYVDEVTGEPNESNPQGKRYSKYLKYCANREGPLGESDLPIGDLFDKELWTSLGGGFSEMLSDPLWHTGHACVSGQPTTTDDRASRVAEIDDSYLVSEDEMDLSILSGTPGAKLASTEVLSSAGLSDAEKEMEMFRVFTMDMALLDDIDGEMPTNVANTSAGSSGSGGGEGTTGVFGWPMSGEGMVVTSCFAPRWGTFHAALDIANPPSNPADIIASDGGKVVMVRNGYGTPPLSGYGESVVIEHDNGYYTRYSHMKSGSIVVSEGEMVSKGDKLGVQGTTGSSTGDHLDFGIGKELPPLTNNAENPLKHFDIPAGVSNNAGCTPEQGYM